MRPPRCRWCFDEAPFGDARNQWLAVHGSITHKLTSFAKNRFKVLPAGHGEPLQLQHFRGELADGQKFVFCPIGYIVSWHPGDYDHGYCHWCQKLFVDLTQEEAPSA
mgnify:CR=1 FL=1